MDGPRKQKNWWRKVFLSTRLIFFSDFRHIFQLCSNISSIFRPYSHSRGISRVFHHASGPSIMVYHKFTQTQHRPLSVLPRKGFPWPCHGEKHMYFVYIYIFNKEFNDFSKPFHGSTEKVANKIDRAIYIYTHIRK